MKPLSYTRREVIERLFIYHLIAALGVLIPALEALSRGEKVFWPLVAGTTLLAMANTHRAFIDKTPASQDAAPESGNPATFPAELRQSGNEPEEIPPLGVKDSP